MKRVIIVVPTLKLGGQQHVAVRTAEILKKKNDDVIIVVFDSRDSAYSYDGEVISLDVHAVPSKVLKIRNVFLRVSKFNSIVRRTCPDVIIGFGDSANILVALAKTNAKRVLEFRNCFTGCLNIIERWMYNRAHKIVFVSEVAKQIFINNNPQVKRPLEVLYNPYNSCEILKLGEANINDYSFTKKTIVSQGRLEDVKNYQMLIRAFKIALENYSDMQLLIIGEGSLREKLETLIQELGIENSVKLIGFRNNPYAYLKKSSVYVLSSHTEGFPNALVEAMHFIPVISVDCESGPREILSPCNQVDAIRDCFEADYGILVPKEKSEKNNEGHNEDIILAQAIVKLVTSQEKWLHYKKRAMMRVLDFSEEVYYERLIEIIK